MKMICGSVLVAHDNPQSWLRHWGFLWDSCMLSEWQGSSEVLSIASLFSPNIKQDFLKSFGAWVGLILGIIYVFSLKPFPIPRIVLVKPTRGEHLKSEIYSRIS